MNTLTPSQQEIAIHAYQLYLNSGCKHGSDWDHWFQAEREVGAKFFTPPTAKTSDAKVTEATAANAKAPDAKAAPVTKKAAKKVSAKKASAKKAAGKK